MMTATINIVLGLLLLLFVDPTLTPEAQSRAGGLKTKY